MILKCLLTLLVFGIVLSYEIERNLNTFGGVRIISPVLKNSFHHYHQPQYANLMKVNSDNQKIQKFKREYVDNVRGEHIPSSRDDILRIKKLQFHGRPSNAVPLPDENLTTHPPPPTTTTTTTPKPVATTRKPFLYETMPKRPLQRHDYYVPSRKHMSPKYSKKDVSPNNDNQVIRAAHYVPYDSPFYPLMKPSPINVMPTEPPSFDTVRNYVQYLKSRQNKFFNDFDEEEKPVARKVTVPTQFDGEIDYFKEREKQLVHEEELHNQFSPVDFGTNDRTSDTYDDDRVAVERPYKEFSSDESDVNSSSTHNNDDDDDNDANGYDENAELHEYYAGDKHNNKNNHDDNNNEDYDEAVAEEESKKKENFIPFRLYAQVRHAEADHHEKPLKSKPRAKEKVSLAKKNIYYKEEGYEDKNYDHGSDKVNYDYDENTKEFVPRKRQKKRTKRSTTDDYDDDLDVSQLPVALAYIKKSELANLNGEKLLKHLDELLRNSSIYLPDDDEDHDDETPIKITNPKKYPNLNLPDTVLSQMHRYSESPKNYPAPKQSLYKFKNIKQCQEITEDIDPVPSDIEEENTPTKYNDKPQRLRGLGDKIECLRSKYFGKDPFDNPLFHEDEYVAATIPISLNHNLSHQSNPLITVYDDVINNIRSGFLDEAKKKRQANDAHKVASEQVVTRIEQTTIPNLKAVMGAVNNFPIFDINNFIPKFQGASINLDDDDDYDDDDEDKKNDNKNDGSAVNELHKINKKQRLQTSNDFKSAEVSERPKVKRNNRIINKFEVQDILPPLPQKPLSTLIKNTKTTKLAKNNPKLTIQKFRRIVPNTLSYATKHVLYYSPPPPQISPQFIQKQQSKNTYHYKLL